MTNNGIDRGSGHGSDRGSGRVDGLVRDGSGAAIAEPTVTVIDPSGRQTARVVGTAGGGFTAHIPVAGNYVLVVSAEGYEPTAVAVIVGAAPVATEVVLGVLPAVKGIVVDAASGRPLAGATAAMTDQDGNVSLVQDAGADGAFVFSGLSGGQYTLVVTAPGCEPVAQTVTVGGSGPTELTVALHVAAELAGTVRDVAAPGGSGIVAHSQVVLLDIGGEMVGSSVTDVQGRYRFENVLPGDYTVIANGYTPAAATVDVVGGRVASHEFVLGAGAGA
ncbi:carboxypeptidase regulatory-like domain-containing protein [Tsukamurella sp. 8F]|uniref:MSCRAMM family protein n=1 Tax=Tsukamurella sp. 8F TaxID=3031961 RepID=UPI0023B914B6|nr:carboxypeptidase regulatory-like domain-containing protein [Tsukamurella sp. 8F]MDF0589067.1 carboxypeptidase regulatory-like domain-containing protein [Tsukamurella sp. 8F]